MVVLGVLQVERRKNMTIKTKLILAGLGVVTLTGLSNKSVRAFAPWDWVKEKLTPAQQSQMTTYHNERDEALAKFMGKSVEEVSRALASGQKPRDLMSAEQLTQWKASRQSIKNQHQQQMGMSEYGHGQGRGYGRGFGRTNSN